MSVCGRAHVCCLVAALHDIERSFVPSHVVQCLQSSRVCVSYRALSPLWPPVYGANPRAPVLIASTIRVCCPSWYGVVAGARSVLDGGGWLAGVLLSVDLARPV